MLSHERLIPTDPQTLWNLVGDLDRWDLMLPTIDEVTRLGPTGPIAVGTRFRVRQPGLIAAEWVVTDWSPGRGFTWEANAMGVRTTATHVLTAEGAATRLALGIGWAGPAGWLVRGLVSRRARSYLDQEAEGFARLAAGRQQTPG